jgi:hypothetical protein
MGRRIILPAWVALAVCAASAVSMSWTPASSRRRRRGGFSSPPHPFFGRETNMDWRWIHLSVFIAAICILGLPTWGPASPATGPLMSDPVVPGMA